MSKTDDIANGYGASASTGGRHLLSKAQLYKPDAALDRIAAMRDQQPDEYAKVPANLKTALGFYEGSKAAYETCKKDGLL